MQQKQCPGTELNHRHADFQSVGRGFEEMAKRGVIFYERDDRETGQKERCAQSVPAPDAGQTPVQQWARRMVAAAIRRGELRRPRSCSTCGSSYARLHAHHFDYLKPLWVAWLCPACHGEWHRRYGAADNWAAQIPEVPPKPPGRWFLWRGQWRPA